MDVIRKEGGTLPQRTGRCWLWKTRDISHATSARHVNGRASTEQHDTIMLSTSSRGACVMKEPPPSESLPSRPQQDLRKPDLLVARTTPGLTTKNHVLRGRDHLERSEGQALHPAPRPVQFGHPELAGGVAGRISRPPKDVGRIRPSLCVLENTYSIYKNRSIVSKSTQQR